MKKITFFLFIFYFFFNLSYAQRHGIIAGGTYGKFAVNTIEKNNIDFNQSSTVNFMLGYGYNFRIEKKLQLGFSLLYGQQDGYFMGKLSQTKMNFRTNYVSLENILKYESIKNLRGGIGIAPTYHLKMSFWSDNRISPIFDIPLVTQLEYQTKYLDIRFAYKMGMINLLKNDLIEKMNLNQFYVSILIPLSNYK